MGLFSMLLDFLKKFSYFRLTADISNITDSLYPKIIINNAEKPN